MPLNISGLANEMKAEIEALYGEPQNNQRLLDFCTAVSTAVINHFKANADIDLASGDIPVSPGTFKDSLAVTITGKGESDPVVLSGKIK